MPRCTTLRVASMMAVALLIVSVPARAQTRAGEVPTVLAASPVQEKSVAWADCSPRPSGLKATVAATVEKLRGLPQEAHEVMFALELDAAVGLDPLFMALHPTVRVPTPEGLSIEVIFPYSLYRSQLKEAIRKREPLADVAIPAGVISVTVTPSRIDAPDIIKIVVERDGKEVPPVLNGLKPTEVTTRMGAKDVLHAGVVAFPCAAFAPRGSSRIIAIPEAGTNITHEISDVELLGYWPRNDARAFAARDALRDALASKMVGWTAARVESLLGKPDNIAGRRWIYSHVWSESPLMVYFNDSNIVWDVQPPKFDFTLLLKK